MKLFKLYICFIIISGCNSNINKKKTEIEKYSIDTLIVSKNIEINNEPDSYENLVDTLKIEDKLFTIIQNDPRSKNQMNLAILNSKKDTIYIHDGYATNGFEIEDFDKDGILDIRLYQITNTGGISELIMFDKSNSIFRPIINFENFPEPTKIEKSDLWYSYHRSGCADINWGSELFKIVNYKAIEIGDIEGIGCEGENINGIFVYRVSGNKKTKMYSEIRKPGYYNDKWDFIEHYWNKNYYKFE
ncbi:hypothetical protein ACFQ1R_12935 [Mariniflexile jejuense]|uniref:VCBS repeat-containing protein n=1 Tax=Mariniflexile jejuense TaxID=1173582 RepID=A0ABW3JL70_9FLAO